MLMCIVNFQGKKRNDVECFLDSFDHGSLFEGIIVRTDVVGCMVVIISTTDDKLGNSGLENLNVLLSYLDTY